MIVYLQMLDSPDERAKFKQLYHRYDGLMHFVAKKILQNEQDAEDAVQQAFLAIIRNASKISIFAATVRLSLYGQNIQKAIDKIRFIW